MKSSSALRRPTPVLSFKRSAAPVLAQRVVSFSVKADAVDKDARTFEGIAAIWTKDLGDDIIHKGAFKNTIKQWKASGEALPLLNSHDHWDIMSALGQLIDAKETDDGLWTKWEVIDGPDGDAVLTRLRPSARTGRAVVGKMSIGYEPVKWEMEASDEARFGQIRHLKEVNLKEVSLVLFPMAPGASIDASSVKQFATLAASTDGATLDVMTKTELRRLNTLIGKLLSPKGKKTEDAPAAGSSPTPSPSTSESGDTGTEDPTPATPETTDTEDGTSGEPGTDPASTDSPTGAAPSPGTESGDPPPADPSTETGEKSDAEPGTYLYSEALQQRLRSTLFRSKVSDLKTTNHQILS